MEAQLNIYVDDDGDIKMQPVDHSMTPEQILLLLKQCEQFIVNDCNNVRKSRTVTLEETRY